MPFSTHPHPSGLGFLQRLVKFYKTQIIIGKEMKQHLRLLKIIFFLSLFLSPIFSSTVHAAADKTVTVPGDALYTGTYEYQGTWNGHNYYKHSTQNLYLYVDDYLGFNLWVLASTLSSPTANVKYYQYPASYLIFHFPSDY